MKIYGFTVVDTEGFDGNESLTRIFKTKEERNEEAYKKFVNELKYCLDEDLVDFVPYGNEDCWEIPDKNEFMKDFEDGYTFITRPDSHFQIESWDAEL